MKDHIHFLALNLVTVGGSSSKLRGWRLVNDGPIFHANDAAILLFAVFGHYQQYAAVLAQKAAELSEKLSQPGELAGMFPWHEPPASVSPGLCSFPAYHDYDQHVHLVGLVSIGAVLGLIRAQPAGA